MNKLKVLMPVTILFILSGFSGVQRVEKEFHKSGELGAGEQMEDSFQRRWTHVSETSAVIYWQLDSINKSATSYIEYGKTSQLGQQTPMTKKPRWAHFHRLTGLETGTTYFYKMVAIDPSDGTRTESEILQLTPQLVPGAIHIPRDMTGNPPYSLSQDGIHYVLTEDITVNGTAFIIDGAKTTFDLDGHTITFGNNTSSQVFGVQIISDDSCKVVNGKFVQGERSSDYSNAVRSFKSSNRGVEICGISTEVHLKNAQPMVFRHSQLEIHHNDITSRVTELTSRHYPGNSLIQVDAAGKNIHIHDNILTEGCHRGIVVSQGANVLTNVEIDHNDIQHHEQYINGYAIAPNSEALVHNNRITSTGRGIHLTSNGIQCYNNYIDIKGHQNLDDLPANTRPFFHNIVELHGIKFEGANVKNCKVYNNFVRIVQPQPTDSLGQGDPTNKADNGVYIRSNATSIENGSLVDSKQNWEIDRWRYYFVKYDPNKPAVKITSNDATTLYGDFEAISSSEYTLYMKWNYVPSTPLNIACYDPNAMNEIYDNTFIAVTTYENTRNGAESDYGNSGEWAATIMFVSMNKGPAETGKYSAYVHDNQFFSNDLFLNSYTSINMDIRIEDNTFNLLNEPFTTERNNRIRNVGSVFEGKVRNSNNAFNDTQTGVKSFTDRSIFVCPNPAHTTITISGVSDGTSEAKVAIYTLNGRKIYETSHEVTFPHQIDISSYSAGVYIVKISKDGLRIMEKIIKK